MTTQIKYVIAGMLLFAGLLTSSGVAIYYKIRVDQILQLNPSPTPSMVRAKPAPAKLPMPPPSNRLQPAGSEIPVEEGVVQALNDRIAELEAALQESQRQLLASRRDLPVAEPVVQEEPRRPREPGEWMAELQANDPERYQAIMQRREEMRKQVNDAYAKKAAHFLNRDVEKMSREEYQEYDRMVQLLTETWQLTANMQNDDLTREQRFELRGALGEKMNELRPILRNQRDREFYDLGVQLGYSNDNAQEFVQYINDMIDITSMNSMFRGGGGGGGGGRGGR